MVEDGGKGNETSSKVVVVGQRRNKASESCVEEATCLSSFMYFLSTRPRDAATHAGDQRGGGSGQTIATKQHSTRHTAGKCQLHLYPLNAARIPKPFYVELAGVPESFCFSA